MRVFRLNLTDRKLDWLAPWRNRIHEDRTTSFLPMDTAPNQSKTMNRFSLSNPIQSGTCLPLATREYRVFFCRLKRSQDQTHTTEQPRSKSRQERHPYRQKQWGVS